MIFRINTTRDISKLSQISLAQRLVKLRITILKCDSWYLCQISLLIMLLPIQTARLHHLPIHNRAIYQLSATNHKQMNKNRK